MKKIVLIQESNSHTYSIKRLKEESENLGNTFKHLKYSELMIRYDKQKFPEVINVSDGLDIINGYDVFLCRSSRDKVRNVSYRHYSYIIKFLAKSKNKYSLNFENSFTHYHHPTKIYNYSVLAAHQVPIVNTLVFPTTELLSLAKLNFPVIVKPADGSLGRGVELVNNLDKLVNYYNVSDKTPPEIVIQEYIKKEGQAEDVRILAIGDEIIGGLKRIGKEGSITTNYSTGGDIENYVVSDDIKEIVIKTMKILKLDYAGIDIIFDGNKPKVLEINNAAQFEGFEKATKINVAKKIVEYILAKV